MKGRRSVIGAYIILASTDSTKNSYFGDTRSGYACMAHKRIAVTICIEPQGDIAKETQTALELLRGAKIKARKVKMVLT